MAWGSLILGPEAAFLPGGTSKARKQRPTAPACSWSLFVRPWSVPLPSVHASVRQKRQNPPKSMKNGLETENWVYEARAEEEMEENCI